MVINFAWGGQGVGRPKKGHSSVTQPACEDGPAPAWLASSEGDLLGLVEGPGQQSPGGKRKREAEFSTPLFGALPSEPRLWAPGRLNLDLSTRALTPALQHLLDLNLL